MEEGVPSEINTGHFQRHMISLLKLIHNKMNLDMERFSVIPADFASHHSNITDYETGVIMDAIKLIKEHGSKYVSKYKTFWDEEV